MEPYKILIAEDEGIIVYQLRKRLVAAGYRVCKPSATGEQALLVARQEQPNLFILDIRLQETMNGLELAEAIRQFSQAPIIFLTGYLDSEMQTRAMVLQPAVYMTKPVNPENLEATVHHLLRQEQSPAQTP